MILCYDYSSHRGDLQLRQNCIMECTDIIYGQRQPRVSKHIWDGLEATSPPVSQYLREEGAIYGSGKTQI